MEKQIRTYRPSSILQPYIEQYSVLEAKEGEGSLPAIKALPNGCPEFVFHYGDPFRFYSEGEVPQESPRALVRGQLKKHITLEPAGQTGAFAVRFRPSGLYSLMGVPLAELTHRSASLHEVYGSAIKSLVERVLNAPGTLERIGFVEQFFRLRLSEGGDPVVYAHHAVDYIRSRHGQVSVADVSKRLGIGERQVERKFNEKVGISPKYFIRITRLNHVLQLLKNHPTLGWAELAYECGYADQAHLINEFRTFAGESPRQFFAHGYTLAEASEN